MIYVMTPLLLVAAGLALLALLRLRTGARAADVALAWTVGAGWFAAAAPTLRFALGIPLGRAAAVGIALAPVAVWAGVARWRRRADAEASARSRGVPTAAARWIPRPLWLFVPVAIYVVGVTVLVVLHGTNSPTFTDDGVRVRAFAPMLAFADAWPPEARTILSFAGPLPTFVPALAWIATGALDHFHVNYVVLTELLAFLLLVVGVASARGSPERGWAGALAVLSIPLFVFHCTSTYADAVLAMRVAGGLLFALEYARTRDRGDAARALLLLGIAALVKREGVLVAAAPAAALVLHLAWDRRRLGAAFPWRAVALAAAPVLVSAPGMVVAAGLAGAYPMLGVVIRQAGVAAGAEGGLASGTIERAAAWFAVDGVFHAGNQGLTFWLLLAVVVLRARAIARGPLLFPLLAVAALLAEVTVSSIFIVPQYTLDQGTVNRALLVASVPAAIFVAGVLADAVASAAVAAAEAETETPAPGARASVAGAGGEGVTPPRRRRPRRGSRR